MEDFLFYICIFILQSLSFFPKKLLKKVFDGTTHEIRTHDFQDSPRTKICVPLRRVELRFLG